MVLARPVMVARLILFYWPGEGSCESPDRMGERESGREGEGRAGDVLKGRLGDQRFHAAEAPELDSAGECDGRAQGSLCRETRARPMGADDGVFGGDGDD